MKDDITRQGERDLQFSYMSIWYLVYVSKALSCYISDVVEKNFPEDNILKVSSF